MTDDARHLTYALHGNWHGSYGSARCPAHDDHTPSLTIRDGDEAVLLTCHAGCARQNIIDELRRRGLWTGSPTGNGVRHDRADFDADQRRALALEIWHEARPAAGTLVETYLRGRGITIPIPASIRFHSTLKHGRTGLYLAAMVAAVQSADRRVIAIHSTFLTSTGRKAPVSDAKMSLGALDDGAVRLAAAGDALALGLCEGIETGLSAMQVHGVPVWCALGCERLHRLFIPPGVRRLVVFADRGEAGERAASKARDAYLAQGRAVAVAWPETGAKDFNDQLRVQHQ